MSRAQWIRNVHSASTDTSTQYITIDWLFVAITRSLTARIYRYEGKELDSIRFEAENYFKAKLPGHKAADLRKGFNWQEYAHYIKYLA